MWFQSPTIAPFEQGERNAFKGPRPEGSKEEGEMKEICAGAGTAGAGGPSGPQCCCQGAQETSLPAAGSAQPTRRRSPEETRRIPHHLPPQTAFMSLNNPGAPQSRRLELWGEDGALSGPARPSSDQTGAKGFIRSKNLHTGLS